MADACGWRTIGTIEDHWEMTLCLGGEWGNTFSSAFPLSFPHLCRQVCLGGAELHRGLGGLSDTTARDRSCILHSSPGCRKTCPLHWGCFTVGYVSVFWDQTLYLYFCIFLWLINWLLVYRSDSAVCRNLAHSECPEVLEDDLSMFICVEPSGVTIFW